MRAQAFGMRVIANDIAPDAMFAAQHNIEMTGFGRVLEGRTWSAYTCR
ncbi:MAG: hypothetical protein HND48_25625 [Chloroflexi bacterium]|nr:hypothetical protein [Chloroflexota bacterium]